MTSGEQIIRDLEDRRKALNERLMNSKTIDEANNIERELWALRAAIRHCKRATLGEKGYPAAANPTLSSTDVSSP